MNKIPYEEIGQVLKDLMDVYIANGCPGYALPDEHVAVAHFLCYPDEYEK